MDSTITAVVDALRLTGRTSDTEALEGILEALTEPIGTDDDYDAIAEAAVAARVRLQQRQVNSRLR